MLDDERVRDGIGTGDHTRTSTTTAPMMLIAAAYVGCLLISAFFLFNLKKHISLPKSCWFCSTRQWVKCSLLNSFTCTNCGQYNGFKSDGSYNKEIPEMKSRQPISSTPVYCRPGSDFNTMPISNGLCEDCNRKQEIITNLLRDFDAVDEDHYFDELDTYKHKLDQKYPLCDRCEVFTVQKLRADKVRFGFGTPVSSNAKSTVTGVRSSFLPPAAQNCGHVTRRRKLFFSSGKTAIGAQLLVGALSMVVYQSYVVAQMTQYSKSPFAVETFFSPGVVDFLIGVTTWVSWISVFSTAITIYGSRKSLCRFNFADLLTILSWPFLAICAYRKEAEPPTMTLIATFNLIVSMLALFIPRKRKHIRRPNTIYSAFSVASTPVSQCSSRFMASRASIGNRANSAATPQNLSSQNLPEDVTMHSVEGETPGTKEGWMNDFMAYRNPKESFNSRPGTPTSGINCQLEFLNLDGKSGHGRGGRSFLGNDEEAPKGALLSPNALTPGSRQGSSVFSANQPRRVGAGAGSTVAGSTVSFKSTRSSFTAPSYSARSSVSQRSPFRHTSTSSSTTVFAPHPPLSFAPSHFTSVSQQVPGSTFGFFIAILPYLLFTAFLTAASMGIVMYYVFTPPPQIMPAPAAYDQPGETFTGEF